MIIAAEYSFNSGDTIKDTKSHLLQEVEDMIINVDASQCKIKRSKEITMPGKMLYSPTSLNNAYAKGFKTKGWEKQRVKCDYPTDYYRPEYLPKNISQKAYREMDFLKGDYIQCCPLVAFEYTQ